MAVLCDHGDVNFLSISSPPAITTVCYKWQPGVQQTEEEYEANTGLLHPYGMVTASRNNNQLESGFMNKWSIPRRPYFPRFSLFS